MITTMKKVLISITTLFGGGAERVVSVWASQLADMNYDVSVLLYGRGPNEYQISSKVHIYTVAETYEDYKKLNYFSRLSLMRKAIKSVKPDVMINFLPRMQIWVMLASFGIKSFRIETVRNSPWEICTSHKIEHWLWMQTFRRANAVIVQTDEQREYFSESIQKKCITIPNPLSEKFIASEKKEYSQKNTKFIAAGRLTSQKNYPLMIRAFAKAYKNNNNIELKIFGAGNSTDSAYPKELQNLIDSLGMKDIIILMGRTNNIQHELLDSDAFIMSSDFEGMPNALAEAMAIGLVCVSTKCKTGPKDLIDNQVNGFLVDVGDEEAMCGALLKIINMSYDETVTMGKKARKKILNTCCEEQSLNKLKMLLEILEK